MLRRLLILAALAFACSPESNRLPAAVTTAGDPLLQHHEIRVDQLPKPFATSSSGNPPHVESQPANATLHLPPGFHISLFAGKLDNPRAMLLAPNGDVIVSEPEAGRIPTL